MIQLDERDSAKVRRVFFHELGHYVAAILSQRYFSGLGSRYIKIYRCRNKPEEFCGEMEPIKPENYNEKDLYLERLPENLVGLVYGCIFQSYFSKFINVSFCFEHFGGNDMCSFKGGIAKHRLGEVKAIKLHELYREHYTKIYDDKDLELLSEIDYKLLLIPNKDKEDEYFIDLSMLDSLLEGFLEDFKDIYCKLVMDFREIIFE
ncbi:hypothetical protein CMU30_06895 [Elizabethkingia anophelis]|nr:hypothetical protein [Elizabethkingia anophelis]MDV3684139.1 hypothetical protein [Elizabethkingia anophelis]MDV3700967.1 hypothetical protein [Elizabethkingia anophelis]MDV3763123.1 hypothetical protein [Elizabethkingia anophelis]MDV3801267.1 hypothetical protein [Elizabethkingia anophelis]